MNCIRYCFSPTVHEYSQICTVYLLCCNLCINTLQSPVSIFVIFFLFCIDSINTSFQLLVLSFAQLYLDYVTVVWFRHKHSTDQWFRISKVYDPREKWVDRYDVYYTRVTTDILVQSWICRNCCLVFWIYRLWHFD